MDRLGHLRREAPLHALMLGVMVVAMASHSAIAPIAGAGLLVAVSVPCAALSRSMLFLRAHVLDLWAMALVLLASVQSQAVQSHAAGHHVISVPTGAALAVIAAAWAAARVWLGMRGSGGARRAAVASGGITALGLVAMAVFCG